MNASLRTALRRMCSSVVFAMSGIFLLGFASKHESEQPAYILTDLGASVSPTDINNKGQIVGTFARGPGMRSAKSFIYEAGKRRTLPISGDFTAVYANRINEAGIVVGTMRTAVSTQGDRGFRYDFVRNLMELIPTLGGKSSHAWDVNAAGQIVGDADAPATQASFFKRSRAFIFKDARITDINTLDGEDSNAIAYAINNAGQVVGNSMHLPVREGWEAFLYKDGKMVGLGTLGGRDSEAEGINDKGQVVGNSDVKGDNYTHAFLYDRGKMKDIYPSARSEVRAKAINNQGQIVGTYHILSTKPYDHLHGFLWKNGNLLDLNRLMPHTDWILAYPELINDKGQIVGVGIYKERERGFLLTPVSR